MGLFSQLCDACCDPILPAFNTNDVNEWMSHAVSIRALGDPTEVTIVEGVYDGYGRLINDETDEVHERVVGYGTGATVYHRACWELSGSPQHYRGESANAPDQGHFFDEGDYNIPDPRLLQTGTVIVDIGQPGWPAVIDQLLTKRHEERLNKGGQ